MKEVFTYINFGCGTRTSDRFLNYDSSPSLYLQRLPVIGRLFRKITIRFPDNVLYGNIVSGLPLKEDSCQGIFSSHVLEHLSYVDCGIALSNCYTYLKPGGTFRCVLPNFEALVKFYYDEKAKNNMNACNEFLTYSFLGKRERPKSFLGFIKSYFSGSDHLWMWDFDSLKNELVKVGFINIQRSYFNESIDPTFKTVEDKTRFDYDSLCIEASK